MSDTLEWVDATTYVSSQPLPNLLHSIGTLNAEDAVKAWQVVRDARCGGDCNFIGMNLHSTNVVDSIVHNVRKRNLLRKIKSIFRALP